MDHARLAATAKRLVDANGRPLTLVQLNRGPDNPVREWEGAASTRGTPTATLDAIGCFVVPDTNLRLGRSDRIKDLIARSDRLVYVASTTDLSNFNELIDSADSQRYTILSAEVLHPGSVIMLWWLFVKR